MESKIQISTGHDFVKVNVSNSKNDSIAFELKFAKDLTVAELKNKLEIITGGNAGTMQLKLFNGDKLVGDINNDAALLGSYPVENGMRIHVIDSFAGLTEESVEKFELTNDQYESKNDTVRNFLKTNKLGKYNEEEQRQKDEQRRQQIKEEQERAQRCSVGSRCQVTVAGNPTRRGTIMYNGTLEGKKGIFIGVKYDEPLGKNDGSVNGKRYFECQPNYGGFVNPMAVEVGDFPPEVTDLDDEI